MAYKDAGELTRGFATDPDFDEIACKVFLYYLSQAADPSVQGLTMEWDPKKVLMKLGISREAYDKTMQALIKKGFINVEEVGEHQQVIRACVDG